MPEVVAGAEPFSAAGGAAGVLVLHGFTGSPHSMRPLAEAFAAAGFTVELPRLPGHGTTVEDMAGYRFDDWAAAAEAAYADLAARCGQVVVAGLSMGGTLALRLAADHPEIAGAVLVNPLVDVTTQGTRGMREGLQAAPEPYVPGIGSDIAAEGVEEGRLPPRAGRGAALAAGRRRRADAPAAGAAAPAAAAQQPAGPRRRAGLRRPPPGARRQ